MYYKKYLFVIIFFLFSNCTSENLVKNKPALIFKDFFVNKGFTLKYDENLFFDGIISNKINERDLIIFQKNLTKGTKVKITNLLNNKSLIAEVGKKSNYPTFNNSVISKRIFDELNININEPYIEITAISDNSSFVAKKSKIFEEEKKVANKVPVTSISVDDLNSKNKKEKNKKKTNHKFSYFIKIADFYFNNTAQQMLKRINTETKTKKSKIKKISDKRYRVYLGPFNNINSLQKSFNDIKVLEFENIEIIKND